MRLLLATNHLGLGGSESYLLTVAEQLDRLGHGVAIFAPEGGPGRAVAEEREVPLVDENELGEFDAAVVQDSVVAHRVAAERPGMPQAFVAHSEMFDLQAPPQLDGAVGVAIALNDRVAARLRAMATGVEVLRLRQPIDVERFVARGPLPQVPRRALLLSNTSHADRLRAIEEACEAAGMELARVGAPTGAATDIRAALNEADVVIGYGRSILEAMACGKAAYVYDWNGGDGWVTAESYPEIEADGFSGRSGRRTIDRERLAEDLRGYAQTMGTVNRDLVIGYHRAGPHAVQLLEAIRGLGPPPARPREPLREMARLVRLEWRAQLDIHALRRENMKLGERLREAEEARLREAEEHRREVAETASRVEAETRAIYENSVSWRLTGPLRRLASRLRGLLGR